MIRGKAVAAHANRDDRLSDVAIIGMAGRFPGAKSVEELWRNLRDGVEAVTFWSDEELSASGVDPQLLKDPNYVKACFYLEDFDLFDAGFFEINPREAELTDPQQRVFLECAWEALEDAGYDPSRAGSIGVFAGSGRSLYLIHNLLSNPDVLESMGVVAVSLSNEKDFVATRVSYKLDLKGPSVTVQNACSTSLVAVHLGCQSLLSGECDMVLAGGVCIAALRKEGYYYVDGGIFAPDGHLRAFDKRAGGQVGGNGAAIVVLKRLEDALADGDSIRGVLRGSALNNDGIQKVSFSAPGVEGQARVIAEALEVAGVHPEMIGYVETHGTGTQLGDPIEVAALTRAWRQWTQKHGFCPIGSIKTNIGHLDAAAGAAGLIKVALSFQHGMIPPSLNFDEPNPEIDFASSPFFVNAELRAWPKTPGKPRRAGVSAFGMGGTNAHVIVEEPPEPRPTSAARPSQLLLISARSEAALEKATANLAKHLEQDRKADLADVAYTTHVGRRAFRHRRALLCKERVEAAKALRQGDRRLSVTAVASPRGRPVAFLFTGQGAQYPNMMRGLYEADALYRAELDRCCEILHPWLGRDLRDWIYPRAGREEEAAQELARTQTTQPALFAVEWALARRWIEWGVEPDAMLGHSIGEYVAAALAGVFSLEDALRLVAARGRCIGSLPAGGSMMAVHLAEEDLEALLSRGLAGLSIAAINAPSLCVVSGAEASVAVLERDLGSSGVSTRRLLTSHAFHSSLVDPILERFREEVQQVRLCAPERPFVSCSTGQWITTEALDPDYWVQHVRRPVRFAKGVATLTDKSSRLLLEVGPGPTLASLARLCTGGSAEWPIVSSARHPQEIADDTEFLLNALGQVWAHGVEVSWERFHAGERRRRVPLPTYPFERRRYFVDVRRKKAARSPEALVRKPDVADWFYVPSWKRSALGAPVTSRASLAGAQRDGDAWLLFADSNGLAAAVAPLLGGFPVTIVAAESFERLDHGRFAIDPASVEDYRSLLEAVRKEGRVLRGIAHLWCADAVDRRSDQELRTLHERGFVSLLHLGQALAESPQRPDLPHDSRGEAPLPVCVVTTGMQDVLGGELAYPEKAVVLGACKAIASEVPGVVCRAVDVEFPGSEGLALAAARLAEELGSDSKDPAVAWRGSHRWVAGYEPLRLAGRSGDGATRLRRRGVYVVTGGLGGIGLALCELLAKSAEARLVLTQRSTLPERALWDAWIAEHGTHDATSRKILAVRRLEGLGAEVVTVQADASDEREMSDAIDQGIARFGTVHGVIHAAGLPGAGILSLKTREEAELVLAPKVRGTQVLERILEERGIDPDFIVLCSSLATAVTAVGQVDYFAANAFLDAWAWHRRPERTGKRTRVVSIGWDAWREVGMAVDTVVPEALRRAREENLRLGLSSDEGREVLRRVLEADLPQVLVSTRDLLTRIAEHAREVAAPEEPEATARPAEPSSTHARPAHSTEYQPPESDLEREIAALWADLLGIEQVGVRDSFFELGGNSLLLMQLSARLRTRYGVALSIRALFEIPDVASLSERIASLRAVSSQPARGEVRGETEEFAL